MNLLLLTQSDLQSDGCYRVDDSRHLHIRGLLKLRSGDQLSVGVLNGPRGIGRILSTDDLATIIELGPMTLSPAPSVAIDLLCAVPRPKIMRKVLYVAGMFGVRSLHFMRANRTEKSYLDSPIFRDGHFEQYLVAGLSQGEWTRMPEVTVHPLFRPFVEDQLPSLPGFGEAPKLLADLGNWPMIGHFLTGQSVTQVVLAIGPEGGWVDFERDLLGRAGFLSFSLGKANLRVEFALAAALGQLELSLSR